MPKQNLLFIINIETQFSSLLPLASFLRENSVYNPIFFLDFSYHNLHTEQAFCEKNTFEYVTFSENSIQQANNLSVLMRLFLVSLTVINFVLFRLFKTRYQEFFGHLRNRIQQRINIIDTLKSILNDFQIKVIVFSEASAGYQAPEFVTIANKSKIPTLLIPFTVANKLEFAESYLRHLPIYEVKGIAKKTLAFLSPKWVFKYKDKQLLFFPLLEILAMEIVGLAPKQPWIYNGLDLSKIILDNDFLKEYYLKEDIDKDKIAVLGTLYMDICHKKMINKTYYIEEITHFLNFETVKPIVLCAMPPDFYPNPNYDGYDKMITEWVKMFNQQDKHNIILSLHPRSTYENFKHFENDKIRIFRGNIVEVMPLCDIFVASISATIRMAIACKKIVLNYDVFQWNYTEYQAVDTVITVDNSIDFAEKFTLLTSNKVYLDENIEKYQKYKDFFGKIDGKSGERIITLLDELTHTTNYKNNS